MSHPSLAGKAFVVTGGASGIGLAVTQKLASNGGVVHIVDRAAKPPSEVSQWPKLVHFHGGVDVSSRSEVTRVYQDITAISPKLYGLANCAGIAEIGHGYVEPDEIFEKVMAVNTFGVFYMTTAFLKLIDDETPNTGPPKAGAVPEGRGSIVNIGSNASYVAYPMMTGYIASKHAVLGMTRSWAVDWIHAGVRVNLVAPGGTDTPMLRAQAKHISATAEVNASGELRGANRELPMGRVARPEEMANAVLFLLSDNASYINGQMLKVNGGWP